jgi:hypothetical protein
MGISKQGIVLLKYASLSSIRSETTQCAAFVLCYVEPILPDDPITPTKNHTAFLLSSLNAQGQKLHSQRIDSLPLD